MKIIKIIFLFFVAISTYSKPLNVDERLKSLELSIHKVIQINDSLVKINSKYEERDKNDNELLDRYDKLNNTLFSWAGWLIAIFGLVVPLIGYIAVFFSTARERKEAQIHLDESKALLSDIKNEMENKFFEYFKKAKEMQIDKILDALIEGKSGNLEDNIYFIHDNNTEKFNDSQVIKIIKLIKSEKYNNDLLMECLLFNDNIFIEDFLLEVLRSNASYAGDDCNYPITYFSKYNKRKHVGDIAKAIIRDRSIQTIFSYLQQNPDFAMAILNNEYIIKSMGDEELTFGRTLEKNNPYPKLNYKDTLFFTKFKELDGTNIS